jgi:threonine dehydrogenase-like Zn-dependent dehydrogenase
VPAGVSLAQAALTEPLAVVIKALRRLGSKSEGDRPRRCCVIGAGTIGHLFARVLALRGHAVTVIDKDASRLAKLGGSVATTPTLDDIRSFDWIVEATGDQRVLATVLERSGTGATLLLVGFPYAEDQFSFESVVSFDRSIIGSVGSNHGDFDEALATLPRLDTAPFLESSFPLEAFEQAWEMARSRGVLKVMLRADGNAG